MSSFSCSFSELEKELERRQEVLEMSIEELKLNLKKTSLTIISGLRVPPPPLRMVFEAVFLLLDEKKYDDWRAIQRRIKHHDFFRGLVEISKPISKKKLDLFNRNYLQRENWEHKIVNRASKCCGLLFNWANALFHYFQIVIQFDEERINFYAFMRSVKPAKISQQPKRKEEEEEEGEERGKGEREGKEEEEGRGEKEAVKQREDEEEAEKEETKEEREKEKEQKIETKEEEKEEREERDLKNI